MLILTNTFIWHTRVLVFTLFSEKGLGAIFLFSCCNVELCTGLYTILWKITGDYVVFFSDMHCTNKVDAKSLYRSLASSHFYETEYEIWAYRVEN